MGLFTNLCRNLGLMVHNINHPDPRSDRKVVSKKVEEEHRGDITLRRTTIEEIEIRNDAKDH